MGQRMTVPAKKRQFILVSPSRRKEFENSAVFFEPESIRSHQVSINRIALYKNAVHSSGWFVCGDTYYVGPSPLFDYLHAKFSGPHRWRLVVGGSHPRQGFVHPVVHWALIQFNNEADWGLFKLGQPRF
jgi:hypothetical protein